MQSSSNATNSNEISTPATPVTKSKPGSLTGILIVSLLVCVVLNVSFRQLGARFMDRGISGVDEEGFMVVDDRMMRIGDLFYFVAIFFAAPSGLLGFILLVNLATKSASDPGARLDSLGIAFWVILAIACIPIVLMAYDVLNAPPGADRDASNDRKWLYLKSGIFLVTLSVVPFGIRLRRRNLRAAALLKQSGA